MEEKIEFFDQNYGLIAREIRFFETLKNEHCYWSKIRLFLFLQHYLK